MRGTKPYAFNPAGESTMKPAFQGYAIQTVRDMEYSSANSHQSLDEGSSQGMFIPQTPLPALFTGRESSSGLHIVMHMSRYKLSRMYG